MKHLSFQYPAWFLVFCLLLGLGVALALYFRDRQFKEQGQWLIWLLGGFRFLTVSLLSTLLLSPLLRSIQVDTQPPVVVLAQDASESVVADLGPAEREAYLERLNALARTLGEEYEVAEYSFGSDVRPGIDTSFSDKVSNLSAFLTSMYDLYSNQNLGAIIMATDGIYNEGSNPVYTNTRLATPVFTIALGDTTPKRDLLVKRVFHNRIAYLGDRFSIQVDMAGQNCGGSTTALTVYKVEGNNLQQLHRETVNISGEDYFDTREIILDADRSGVQRYRIVLGQISDEATTANNSKDIFVDVLDARQKILILANSPHPDLTALRQSISANKNYQVKVDYASNPKEDVSKYDFVILHQLPSRSNDIAGVLNILKTRNIPHLFIVGTQTNMVRFNQVQELINIQGDGRNTNEVQGRVAPNFSLFTLEEPLVEQLPNFAPLLAPFGEFEAADDASVLLYQRIGRIDTRYPLLVMGEKDGSKVGVLAAEGLWKWRLFDFLQNENHANFDELFGKTIQYLTLKEDKRRFRVSLDKNIFNENEPIFFDAELYNESYQLINEPDVSLIITDAEGNEFSYTFDKTENAYSLNAGSLTVGTYTFRGSVFSAGENLTYNGQFSVQPIQLELYETTADHRLLRLLSEKYGGRVVDSRDLAGLPAMLAEKGTVKPVMYETTQTRSVINLKWIFFLLTALLTAEWFLRRYFGAY